MFVGRLHAQHRRLLFRRNVEADSDAVDQQRGRVSVQGDVLGA